MQAKLLLHRLLKESCPSMHVTRRTVLGSMVWAAVRCRTLTVTALGRALESEAREKHTIKRADRLLSNRLLQQELTGIYGHWISRLVGEQRHPVILVDWSTLDEWKRNQVLRASLVISGRSFTLYEEVHDRTTAVKRKTHEIFLRRLEQLLPPGCQPVLITDAGFLTPWFQAVEALGWYWVSRIRNPCYIRLSGREAWQAVKDLHGEATCRARHLGTVEVVRSQGHPCELILYRAKARGRYVVNRYGTPSRGHRSLKASRSAREPWVLASNLSVRFNYAGKVVDLYRQRMQIEESFRDMKSRRFGLGLELHRSRDPRRLAVLLLIATLAMLVLWLMGQIARERGLASHYQANTVRDRDVLSVLYLGMRVIARENIDVTLNEIASAWRRITRSSTEAWGKA